MGEARGDGGTERTTSPDLCIGISRSRSLSLVSISLSLSFTPNLSFSVPISVWIGSLDLWCLFLILRVCLCESNQLLSPKLSMHFDCCYPDATRLWASWSNLGLIRKPSNQRGRRILNKSQRAMITPTCERDSNFKTRHGIDKMPFTIVTTLCWVRSNERRNVAVCVSSRSSCVEEIGIWWCSHQFSSLHKILLCSFGTTTLLSS